VRARNLAVSAILPLALLAAAPAARCEVETVRLPVTLDGPMVRSLILQRLFQQPGGGEELELARGGCTRIEAGSPRVNIGDSLMQLILSLRVRAGMGFPGACMDVYGWEGYVELLYRVEYGQDGFRLVFSLQEYHLYESSKQEIRLPWFVGNKVRSSVYEHFDRVVLDLGGPIQDLKALLPEMFEGDDRERIRRSLASVRPGEGRIQAGAIRLEILLDVETQPRPAEPAEELSPEELERATRAWESWDAFLVLEIMKLSGAPLEEDERTAVFQTLVDARQGFVQALADRTAGTALVREQFVKAWTRLASILRKHLTEPPTPALLSTLAFFTASDAIAALDRLGPALGLDISRDGLIRLARLLSDSGPQDPLAYSYEVDPGLRDLLGLGAPLKPYGPAFPAEEIDFPDLAGCAPPPAPGLRRWLGFLAPRPAQAAEPGPPAGWEALAPWVVPRSDKDLAAYLDRVGSLLDETAGEAAARGPVPERYGDLFRLLVRSTCWQETCWRQFDRVRGKLRYMVSYNNTSVGIMQINERVWRGIYALDSLRWDIRYNARAGGEILATYLTRYALKKMSPAAPLDDDTLARAAYAMYNGGPGQFAKFLERHRKGTYFDSDKLFWNKYGLAKEGRFGHIGICLTGRPLSE